MTILNTIKEIDSNYVPDPDGSVDIIGRCIDGKEWHMYLINRGDGPLIYPGEWCILGGIYYNPLIVSVREE